MVSTGVGNCAGLGVTDLLSYFCGSGSNCNNMDGLTCWNPVDGQATSPKCNAFQWQCKTDILTGVGSCTSFGSTNCTTYFCSGPNCNNLEGKKCWNPVNGEEASTPCSSFDWQCTVKKTYISI